MSPIATKNYTMHRIMKTFSANTCKLSLCAFLAVNTGLAQAACDLTVSQTTPKNHFTNNRDGTVTDNTTGLMWSVCLYGQTGSDCTLGSATVSAWDSALIQLDSVINYWPGYLNYTDWRIPNVKELASILEAQCSSPSLNPEVFPINSGGTDATWTSSPDTTTAQNIWAISFNTNGDTVTVDRTTATLGLRLVRGGNGNSGAAMGF